MLAKQIVAFDIGNKRIGVAVTDPFGEYAIPAETYWRTKNFIADVKAVVKIAEDRGAGLIVCGLPVNFDGTPSVQTGITEKFISALKENTKIPVEVADERFTTLEAHEVLRQEGVKRDKKKNAVDSIAASYILEGYLSGLKNKEKEDIMEENEVQDETEEEDDGFITLYDDDGNETVFYHLATVEYEGDKYCVMQLADPETEEEEEEVAIYKLVGEEPDYILEPIEDEELLDAVFEEFCNTYEQYEDGGDYESDEAKKLDE